MGPRPRVGALPVARNQIITHTEPDTKRTQNQQSNQQPRTAGMRKENQTRWVFNIWFWRRQCNRRNNTRISVLYICDRLYAYVCKPNHTTSIYRRKKTEKERTIFIRLRRPAQVYVRVYSIALLSARCRPLRVCLLLVVIFSTPESP